PRGPARGVSRGRRRMHDGAAMRSDHFLGIYRRAHVADRRPAAAVRRAVPAEAGILRRTRRAARALNGTSGNVERRAAQRGEESKGAHIARNVTPAPTNFVILLISSARCASWKQVSLTLNTDSHVLPALQEDAASKMDAILTGS